MGTFERVIEILFAVAKLFAAIVWVLLSCVFLFLCVYALARMFGASPVTGIAVSSVTTLLLLALAIIATWRGRPGWPV